jgi:transposase
MILGYSRMRYVEFTTDISTGNVIRMHINAFSFFVDSHSEGMTHAH